VCIKTGELDLALDVFQQLLREGCTPNLVTYNILIDVRLLPASCYRLQILLSVAHNRAVTAVQLALCPRTSALLLCIATLRCAWRAMLWGWCHNALRLHMCCTALRTTSPRPDDALQRPPIRAPSS